MARFFRYSILSLAFSGALASLPAVAAADAAKESPQKAEFESQQEGELGERRYVLFETTDGDILIELYPDRAPLTVKNFEKYVKDGFYDKTTFHRVIKDFVVQGGGYTPEFDEKETRKPVRNESIDARLRNLRGTIAMARTNDPHSATSQFFFNLKDNSGLDWDGPYGGYTVFGRVVKGMNKVVDDIALIPTGPGPEDAEVVFDRDVPFRPVYVIKARTIPTEEAQAMLAPVEAGGKSSAKKKDAGDAG